MKLKDIIYDFTFYPVKYEFDEFNKNSDLYDLNWLMIRFEFNFKGNKIIEEYARFTTFEMHNFIKELEDELVNNEYHQVRLNPLEPGFNIVVRRKINLFEIYVTYDYHELCEENRIDILLTYTIDELKEFVNELKKEYLNFKYRRIADLCENKVFNSFDKCINTIYNNEIITGELIYNINSLRIKTHEFFNLAIDDAYMINNGKLKYGLRLNSKDFCAIDEYNLINVIEKLYTNNIIVEYFRPIGIRKLKWFDIFEKDEFKLDKFKKKKKVLRIFDANNIYYYNENYISTIQEMIDKHRYDDLNEKLECIYYSNDNKKRIQIIKKENYYTLIFERFKIFEESNIYTTQNYGYWISIDDGASHSYDSIESLEKDISNLLIDYQKV